MVYKHIQMDKPLFLLVSTQGASEGLCSLREWRPLVRQVSQGKTKISPNADISGYKSAHGRVSSISLKVSQPWPLGFGAPGTRRQGKVWKRTMKSEVINVHCHSMSSSQNGRASVSSSDWKFHHNLSTFWIYHKTSQGSFLVNYKRMCGERH